MNMKDKMTAGARLKEAREAAGLTQQQLGEAVGLEPKHAQSLVAGWERDSRPIPRARIIEAARTLGISVEELI